MQKQTQQKAAEEMILAWRLHGTQAAESRLDEEDTHLCGQAQIQNAKGCPCLVRSQHGSGRLSDRAATSEACA
jgi:hypothetical protein